MSRAVEAVQMLGAILSQGETLVREDRIIKVTDPRASPCETAHRHVAQMDSRH